MRSYVRDEFVSFFRTRQHFYIMQGVGKCKSLGQLRLQRIIEVFMIDDDPEDVRSDIGALFT